jgi:sucrose-6-phosphate hydrolase SacC (GH32 family)
VIVGWVAEDDDQGEKRGWQGMHSLPRSIFLSDDGLQLRTRPIEAIRTLRDEASHRYFHNIVFPSTIPFELVPGVSGNQIEIMINWQFPKNQVAIFRNCFIIRFLYEFIFIGFGFRIDCPFNN